MSSKIWPLAIAGLVLGSCRPEATTAVTDAATNPPSATEVLADSDAPEPIAEPIAGDPLGVTIHRLSNGMTVYLSTVRDEPRVSAMVAVRAGGRHDPPHATGLAHYLEHMVLFKGSDELGTVDHAAEVEHLEAIEALYRELPKAADEAARAAVLAKIDVHTQAVAKTTIPNEVTGLWDRLGFSGTNAFTTADRTVYVTEFPSNRAQQWAEVEAERLADRVFRLFTPELEAVYEEKNRGLDDASRRIYEATHAAAFPKHPLGTQAVLGEVAHLKTPAFDEMVAYFDRWYVPNNMAIILAGDVDASILPVLERAFGRLQPAPLERAFEGDLEGPKGRAEVNVVAPGVQSVQISWRTVPASHPDSALLPVIVRLLDDEMVGLLNVDLELSGAAPWVSAYNEPFREAGLTTVEAAVRDDRTHAQVERLLLESVGKLAAGETTQAQLQAAKLRSSIEYARRWEQASARAWRMLDAYTQGEDWRHVAAHEDRIAAMTLQDVQRAAKAYFTGDFVVGNVVRGEAEIEKIAKPQLTPLTFAQTKRSAMAARVEDAAVAPIEPVFLRLGHDATETKTPWGRLIASRNTTNSLFDLIVIVERGMRQAPLLCHAMTLWQRSGTTGRSARELQVALYQLGAGVHANCTEDQVIIYLEGVDEHFDASLALLSEWLSSGRIEPSLTKEVLESTFTQRRTMLDHDQVITAAQRNFAYFGKDSSQLIEPSNAQLRKAKETKLEALVADLLAYEHTVAYYGPRSAQDVAAAVKLGNGKRGPGKKYRRAYRTLAMAEVHVVHRESAQANIHILFPGDPSPTDQLATTQAASAYLSRRAFDDIRGARALAYSVSAGIDPGDQGDDTALWGLVQTQADKTNDALPALLELMRTAAVDGDALQGAVAKVRERLRTQRTDRHFVAYAIADWRRQRLDRDAGAITWDGLDAVDPEAIGTLVERLATAPVVITIVGDTSRMDMQALGTLGRVLRHEPSELFSFGP